MAPRIPETLEEYFKRTKSQFARGATEVRFGEHHATHAVCLENGLFRVRRLELSEDEAKAYLKEHGIFMPEHAEVLSKPGALIHEEASLKALMDWFKTQRWPFF